MQEKLTLEDCFHELEIIDYIPLIQKRLPTKLENEEIGIISRKLHDRNLFIDVAFYFANVKEPREAFYTHFYQKEIEDYLNKKR